MRNEPRRPGRICLALAALAGGLAGCHRSGLELVSFRDPYFPERYTLKLDPCAYRVGPSGDIYAAGRSVRKTDAGTTTQYLYLHIFWKPWPGKTPAEKTTTDALLTYVVANETGVAVYRGTGFAYPKKAIGGLRIEIESARLHLQTQRGDVPDLIGDARLTGTLRPRKDTALAADLIRELELRAAR